MFVSSGAYVSEGVEYLKSWRCRKGGFELIVMKGCDVNDRFWNVTDKNSESTQNSQAWAIS